MNIQLSVLVLLLSVSSLTTGTTGPIVDTSYGPVQGVLKKLDDGREYERFFGVPFGDDTGGSNRWKKPSPPQSWTEPLDCSEYRPYCPQLITKVYPLIKMGGIHSEDCLFLNIYVPKDYNSTQHETLPVMFYLFGGAFLVGASDMYPGELLAVNGQVIVITANYRIGTIGWMSTGDKNSPGNLGLWDDTLALEWVQKNIANFGGDPKRVTIFGQSAGSASVSHLMASDRSRHLFKRMIAISGSAMSYFANTPFYEESARSLALLNLCPIFSYYRMVECLREKGPVRLDLLGLVSPVVFGRHFPNWVPNVDGDFVEQFVRNTVEDGVAADHDIIVGSTHDDGAGLMQINPLGMGYGHLTNTAQSQKLLDTILRLFLNVYDNPDELADAIATKYPDWRSDDVDARTKAASKVLTDYFFGSTATLEALIHSKYSQGTRGKTYVYEFSYPQSFLKYQKWVNGSHLDDLYSVFGEVFMQPFRERFLRTKWNDDDHLMSKYVQSYYSNFAHTGDPNEGPHAVPVFWPQFDGEKRQYLLQTPNMSIQEQDEDLIGRYDFWNKEYFNLIKRKTSWSINQNYEIESKLFEKGMKKVEQLEQLLKLAEHDPETAVKIVFSGIQQLLKEY